LHLDVWPLSQPVENTIFKYSVVTWWKHLKTCLVLIIVMLPRCYFEVVLGFYYDQLLHVHNIMLFKMTCKINKPTNLLTYMKIGNFYIILFIIADKVLRHLSDQTTVHLIISDYSNFHIWINWCDQIYSL